MEPATPKLSPDNLAFLYGRIDFERTASIPTGPAGMQLERMRELLQRLGNPHEELVIAHIAGTKGKGSTAAFLSGMLTAAGFRTGTYSSPHLERLEERLSIDGQACSTEALAALIERVRPAVEAMDAQSGAAAGSPTFFEITTALAMLHFQQEAVELAVFEVGMGGRLDSTNICRPWVSVITSISFDHTRQLGSTLRQIAREKAGIIKAGTPVVSGVRELEPRDVIREVAERNGSQLIELGRDFTFDSRPPAAWSLGGPLAYLDFHDFGQEGRGLVDIPLGMAGKHQAANAAIAIATALQLIDRGLGIPEAAIRSGLSETRVPARIEMVRCDPFVFLDAAHNVASIEALIETLQTIPVSGRRRLIFAATAEKDYAGMLAQVLGYFDEVILTRYQKNPRSADPLVLKRIVEESLRASGREVEIVVRADPVAAWNDCLSTSSPRDLLCISGSFFLAAEMRPIVQRGLGK